MTYRRLKLVLVGTTSLLILATAWPMTGIVSAAEPVKRTFMVQGLHCPPCTRTVEASLKSLKGVAAARVDWSSKNAWITFDESVVSAQQIAGSIASTPHMMGRSMHYQASLALKVPELGDAATGEKAKSTLEAVPGVAAVYVYPQQKSLGIKFQPNGKLTTAGLIEELKKAGVEAKPFE